LFEDSQQQDRHSNHFGTQTSTAFDEIYIITKLKETKIHKVIDFRLAKR
jgi:hypothetical protein